MQIPDTDVQLEGLNGKFVARTEEDTRGRNAEQRNGKRSARAEKASRRQVKKTAQERTASEEIMSFVEVDEIEVEIGCVEIVVTPSRKVSRRLCERGGR